MSLELSKNYQRKTLRGDTVVVITTLLLVVERSYLKDNNNTARSGILKSKNKLRFKLTYSQVFLEIHLLLSGY